jgi:hypothetical protein
MAVKYSIYNDTRPRAYMISLGPMMHHQNIYTGAYSKIGFLTDFVE